MRWNNAMPPTVLGWPVCSTFMKPCGVTDVAARAWNPSMCLCFLCVIFMCPLCVHVWMDPSEISHAL